MQQTDQLVPPSPADARSFGRAQPLDAALPMINGRWSWWLVLCLAIFVFLCHAVLIAGGRWDGDEFFNFTQYRHAGIGYLFFRTLHWSPRPISEFVLYLYGLAVLHWNAPLITPFLGALWLTLAGGDVIAAWLGGRNGRLPRIAIALVVTAMFLLGHPVTEMFFWPMAAAPYLIALPAIVVATFAVIGGQTEQAAGRWIAGIALSIAVLSAETGLFLAVMFGVVLWVLEGRRFRDGLRVVAGAAWYLVPLAISFGVLVCEFRFRVGDATSGVGPTQTYFHHPLPSLIAALRTLPHELILHDGSTSGLSLGASLVMACLLLFGFYCGCAATAFRSAPWKHLVALALALAGAVGIIIFASFYQYGAWGFERHRTFCQCLDVLLLLVLGRIAAQWLPPPPRLAAAGALSLVAAMGVAMTVRLPAIIHDGGLLWEIRKARDLTWDSGNMTDSSAMRFTLPPNGLVIASPPWQAGHYTLDPRSTNMPWYVPGVLAFFGKTTVDIVPFQTH